MLQCSCDDGDDDVVDVAVQLCDDDDVVDVAMQLW